MGEQQDYHQNGVQEQFNPANIKLYDLDSSKHVDSAASDYDYPIYKDPEQQDEIPANVDNFVDTGVNEDKQPYMFNNLQNQFE